MHTQTKQQIHMALSTELQSTALTLNYMYMYMYLGVGVIHYIHVHVCMQHWLLTWAFK